LHGANRLGGNSLSDLVVFGKLAGEYAAKWAKQNSVGKINEAQVDAAAKWALEPFDRGASGENPYIVQQELQDMMQDLVGIVRKESEMARALEGLSKLRARTAKVGVPGNREYNPGWHTCMDLRNLLLISEAITRCAIERKESRGAQFREDYPAKSDEFGKFNHVVRHEGGGGNTDGRMLLERKPVSPIPDELKKVIEENK
jgi:succinate dehydrogenase / fumarate reductase, flavoprotein subunit